MAHVIRKTRNRPTIHDSQSASTPYIGIALGVLLLVALLTWQGSSAAASASGTGVPGGNAGRYFWCGQTGQPACPANDPGWIPLTSKLPGDVAAAISKHKMFVAVQTRHGHLKLDLPVLVHPFGTQGGAGSDYYLDDHWVVSVRNDSGQECGLFDFVYDSAQQRIRFSSYSVVDQHSSRYGQVFPYVSASGANARTQKERHIGSKQGSTPQLIFFPLARDWEGPQASHHWTSGGDAPTDPMWLVAGSDGRNYFVGMDQQTHTEQELPIASAHS